jgi:hypothetical protein
MFGNNGLPLPSNFAYEHRPLRLTGEGSRPQPTGSCHFVLLHPSVQNQRCSCQTFHHNRSAPGNICDCGHQACYHLPDSSSHDHQRPVESVSLATERALSERIKRLEETIQNEREFRENTMQRERQIWEREVRILREALAPFYKSESEMRRKLVELEDRVEGNYDEHVRLKERVVAIDDANMTVERRVEDLEISRGKRRRMSRQYLQDDGIPNGQPVDDLRRPPSNVDERSIHSASSRALSPNSNMTTVPESEEPRSSGILNLMEMPRSTPHAAPKARPPTQEPRSSGFLALDLAERLSNRKVPPESAKDLILPPTFPAATGIHNPPNYARSNPDDTFERRSPVIPRPLHNGLIANGVRSMPSDISPRKRKHIPDHMALDVLADVSVASPLIY